MNQKQLRQEWGLFILIGIIAAVCLAALFISSVVYYDDNGRWPWANAKPVSVVAEKVQALVEATPISALPLPQTPLKLKTSGSVPDSQEETLNKMGLTKQGGAKPDLSGMTSPTTSTTTIKK